MWSLYVLIFNHGLIPAPWHNIYSLRFWWFSKSWGPQKIQKKDACWTSWGSQPWKLVIAGDGFCHLGTIFEFTPSTLAHRHLLRTQVRPVTDWSVGDKQHPMVIQDGHVLWNLSMCILELEVITARAFFLVMVIGWVFGGWRKPLCGFQITDDWLIDPTNIIGPVEFMLKDVPQRLWRTQLANRSNGDDFRWSKAAVETAWKRNKHRYSQMCSLDTSKVK